LVLALFAGLGCESIALVGRESLKLEPAEVVAEVERVDSRLKEIHLRPNSDRISVVSYTGDTRVIYRGREHPVENLEAGDVVAMHVKEDPAGRFQSEFLSIRQRRQDRDMPR
jgi:hypothetical protein